MTVYNTNESFGISGNNLFRKGNIIVKQYQNHSKNLSIEATTLNYLKNLKVPNVLKSDYAQKVLHLKYIDGLNGKQAVENGFAGQLLQEMGRFILELQTVDPSPLAGILPGNGTVICHGDFAHYNALVSKEDSSLMAIIDWESSFIGDPISDICWCEFQFLRQFPNSKWAVRHLFEGFGSTPSYEQRENIIQTRLEFLQNNNLHE